MYVDQHLLACYVKILGWISGISLKLYIHLYYMNINRRGSKHYLKIEYDFEAQTQHSSLPLCLQTLNGQCNMSCWCMEGVHNLFLTSHTFTVEHL